MPARINLTHKRGDLFEKSFLVRETIDGVATPLDFTGKRVRMMIRADKDDRDTAALADLGNDGGRTGITAGGDGYIHIEEVIDIAAGCHDYDIEVSDAGDDPVTHIEGKFTVRNDATFTA